jgi:photosystem II stability/assembly factor-like uncharacterized protein
MIKMSIPSHNGKLIKLLILSVLLYSITAGCKGKTWVAAKPPPNLYKITAQNLHGVDTVGTDRIWAVGSYGGIFHSMDGGKSWARQVSRSENLLCAVYFVNENLGWASGIYGTVLHTEDGGKNWVRQNTGTGEHLFDICFVNKDVGWTVGMGTILHTTDGGKTWAQQREKEDVNLNAVCFLDENTGWVVGEFGRIYHTTDGGKSWIQQKPPTLFVNEDDPWGDVPLALYGVTFVDKNRGWVIGISGLLLRTDDGGKTWTDLRDELNTEAPFYDIEFKGNLGWIVGGCGSYLLTQDHGKTWKLLEDVIKTRFWLHGISFTDSSKGWIVGARGAVVKTEDGGNTWTMLSGLTYDVPEYGLTDF